MTWGMPFQSSRVATLLLSAGFILQAIPLWNAIEQSNDDLASTLRAVACIVAALALIVRLPVQPSSNPRSWIVLLLLSCLPILSIDLPMAMASLSWGLYAIAALQCMQRKSDEVSRLLLLLLLCLCFPLETIYSSLLDPYIQFSTAFYAAPLVTWTGFPIEIVNPQSAMLYGNDLIVHITPLCAGLQTFTNILSIGIIASLFFLKSKYKQLIFCSLTLIVSFVMNTLRIAISTHAANNLLGTTGNWELAHEVIGYASFAATYLCLFVLIKKLQTSSLFSTRI